MTALIAGCNWAGFFSASAFAILTHFTANPKGATMKTLIALLLMTTAATAQQRCADRQIVLERLQGKYTETRRMMGMTPSNSIVEMHASTKTGSWTITVTHPNGQMCMVAAGMAYETIAEPEGDAL